MLCKIARAARALIVAGAEVVGLLALVVGGAHRELHERRDRRLAEEAGRLVRVVRRPLLGVGEVVGVDEQQRADGGAVGEQRARAVDAAALAEPLEVRRPRRGAQLGGVRRIEVNSAVRAAGKCSAFLSPIAARAHPYELKGERVGAALGPKRLESCAARVAPVPNVPRAGVLVAA